uniref:Uncharacterized protein n=1 Tax=Platysiphonia delicata TaxID=2006979 RepID=A0A1Z1M1F2_9FLOR|nr:hypothetical protein [Platysiphonia delicata]ARW59615.1 hypothetical protein [Platysiphonia delicata]
MILHYVILVYDLFLKIKLYKESVFSNDIFYINYAILTLRSI